MNECVYEMFTSVHEFLSLILLFVLVHALGLVDNFEPIEILVK